MKSGRPILLAMVAVLGASIGQAGTDQNQELTRDEVSRHATKTDCWIIIDDVVYDITAAVKDHVRYKYELDPWCGKEASKAWHTKDGKNKAHSRKAQLMLKELRKGSIKGS